MTTELTLDEAAYFIYFAQLTGIVGSGFLAQSIGQLFDDTSKVVWLGSVINILTLALTPPISQAADLWGRKWFLVVSAIFGFAGCMIVSRAETMGTVIVGYTILGIGYGCQSLLLAVISEVLPRKHRSFAQAGASCFGGLGGILGLLMGGALVKNANLENFRIYFYVNAAIFLSASIIFIILYNPPPRELQRTLSWPEKFSNLDWIGYMFLTPGLTLLSVGLAWSYNPYRWSNAHVLIPFILGIIFVAVFAVYESRLKKDGMLHHDLFRHRNFPIGVVTIFIEGFIFFSCNNYYTFEVALFAHSDALIVGLHFSIVFWVSLLAAAAVGFYSSWKRVVRVPMIGGFVFLLIFNILMATSTNNTSGGAFWGYTVLAGAGLGTILPVVVTAAQLSTTAEHIALSSGLVVASRAAGAVFSLAINNAIFNSALFQLGPKIAAASVPLGLPPSSLGSLITGLASGNQAALQHTKGLTPQIMKAALEAFYSVYNLAFRNVWICATCLACAAVVGKNFDFFLISSPAMNFGSKILM